MVEPVASLMLNALLTPSKNPQAAVSAVRRASRKALASDFFSPTPRRTKGKEKEHVDYENDVEHLLQCQDWICSVKASSWCPRKHRILLLREFAHKKDRPCRSPSVQLPLRTRHPPSLVRISSQRRHVSNTSATLSRVALANPSPRAFQPDSTHSSEPPDPGTGSSDDVFDSRTKEDYYQNLEHLCTLDLVWPSLPRLQEIFDQGVSNGWLSNTAPPHILLAFVGRIITKTEELYRKGRTEDLVEWGPRVEGLLRSIESMSFDKFEQVHLRRCLLSRAIGLSGNLDKAVHVIHGALDSLLVGDEERVEALRAYHSLIQSALAYRDMSGVLDFLVKEWAFIGPYIMDKARFQSITLVEARKIRKSLSDMLSTTPDPTALLESRLDWSKDVLRSQSELLLSLFLQQRDHEAAHSIVRFMQANDIVSGVAERLQLVRMLAQAEHFADATQIFEDIPHGAYKDYVSTGLQLAARCGREDQAKMYYQRLEESNLVDKDDRAMMLYLFANQAKVEETVAAFDSTFPRNHPNATLPTPYHHSIVLYAFAQKGDIDGINSWLERMSADDIPVNAYIYNMVLHSFAKRGDLNSVIAILNQMRAANAQPTVVTYTKVIALLANRKDPVGAETIYKRAMREGIIPDRHLINTLMNAHVEAGSWQGVIRIFDYLRTTTTRSLALTIPMYNTILKAYVLIGTPFKVVARLFSRIQDTHLRPDAYTYSLLIQSACDAGEMHAANDILRDMERLDADDSQVYIYALTTIMAGYLRLGDKLRAKAVYDEMQKRGIEPTPMTFSAIVHAYGNEKSEESLQIAEAFIQDIMTSPKSQRIRDTPSYGKTSALELIYGPLISAHVAESQPEEVERLFQEMLDQGGEPSIGSLTMLMDAYRRSFNIDAVIQIWPQIFRAGLQLAKSSPLLDGDDGEGDPSRLRLKSNVLCIPLSIYIDALSAAGRHQEIANVWKKFRSFGFTFDSHNWNHLVVALVRAGEPERAFEVIERVILPYQQQSELRISSRQPNPATPLEFDEPDIQYGEQPAPPSQAPMHSRPARAFAVRQATERTRNGPAKIDDEIVQGDFIEPLFILHRFSPSWDLWRPHAVSLSVLLMVLVRLRTGSVITPVLAEDASDEVKQEVLELEARGRTLAAEMLARIEKDYPQTVHLLGRYERKERRRLRRGFEDAYLRN